MEMKKSSTSSISFGSGWRAPSGLRLTGRVISTVSAASSRASSSALTCFSLVPNARPKSARSLPMSLPASFFWSFGNAPMALLACVIADSAPAYCVLMAFNSSIVEAFSIFAMPLGNRIGYRLGVEYRTLCHEIPFLSTVCFTHKTRKFQRFTTSHSFNMTRHSQAQQHHRRAGAEIERFRLAVDGNRHDSVDAFQHILGQPARLVAEQHRLGLRK